METLCSLESNDKADHAAREGLGLLIPALLICKAEPENRDARTRALLGAAESVKTSLYGVEKGGSHAIGHQLGPLGVPHGETSCVMLPAVCKYNALKGANVDHQRALAQELLEISEIWSILTSDNVNLGDILDAYIKALDLPRTLEEAGVAPEQFETLAENTLTDAWAKTNPFPLVPKEDVLQILQMAAE